MGKLVRNLKIGQSGKEYKVANKLHTTIRSYLTDTNISKRYIRPKEAAEIFEVSEETVMELALAAGAIHQLPRTTLICKKRLEEFREAPVGMKNPLWKAEG